MASMMHTYCDRCGDELGTQPETTHAECRKQRELEPPRYCPECKRRLVVQVVPTGWEARCSAHGALG
jgi:hypothetical protein